MSKKTKCSECEKPAVIEVAQWVTGESEVQEDGLTAVELTTEVTPYCDAHKPQILPRVFV